MSPPRVLRRTPLGLLALSSLLLAGCGATAKPQAKAPEGYDWSDYKGTYAVADDAPAPASASAPAKSSAAPSKSKPGADPKAELLGTSSSTTTTATSAKKSKATILGESVSSVSVDAVAGASKTVLKGKVVSSDVVVGREFEQIQVVMKGVAVQIIRPAATPDVSGPKVRSPKVRSTGMSKTESGWYDADANVFVLVRAQKKAASQKALAAILKR